MVTQRVVRLVMVVVLMMSPILVLARDVWADELEQKTREFVQQLARRMTEQRRTTVAVLDFAKVEDDTVNAFGRLLAEELVTKLTDIGGFQVVERRFLNKILQEQKWSLTDLVNPKTAVRFGELSGVQALITGTLADEGSYLRVNGRLIGTDTGYVIASAAVTLFKDERITRVWAQVTSSAPGSGAASGAGAPSSVASVGAIRGFEGLPMGKVIARPENVTGSWEIDLANMEVRNDEIELRVGLTNMASRASEGGISSEGTYLVDDQGQQYKATKVLVIGGTRETAWIPPSVRRVVKILFPMPSPHASSVTWVITLPWHNPIVIRNSKPMR